MSQDGQSRSRRELLIDGRRVRISDLLDAELLEAGEELLYQQRIGLDPHRATVTDRGRLRLTDGREFTTPSAAAAAVGKLRAAPGWAVWRVGRDGRSLHQLRQRLLETVAEQVAHSGSVATEATEAVRGRFSVLNEARTKAEAGQPRALTVRELLKLWGVDDRDRAATAQISADLANHGLTTVPDYRAVSLDRTVRMVTLAESEQGEPSDKPADGESKEAASIDEESGADIGLTLGNLLPEGHQLASVLPSATFETAITVMQLNDFSQLAVLADSGTLHGAVSWKSIAEAKHRNPDASFSDAIERGVRVLDYGVRLLDVLTTLQADGFVFVRDYDGVVSGIVTDADVVNKYDETATPFFLIGEVDQELRQLIQNNFDEDTVGQACTAARLTFRSFNSMTIGQYKAVLRDPACWARLGWPLDQELFIERLDEIRKVRNTVMHFNPDPIKASEIDKLRHFLSLIRRYAR